MSCLPPPNYQERFIRFMEKVFVNQRGESITTVVPKGMKGQNLSDQDQRVPKKEINDYLQSGNLSN